MDDPVAICLIVWKNKMKKKMTLIDLGFYLMSSHISHPSYNANHDKYIQCHIGDKYYNVEAMQMPHQPKPTLAGNIGYL